MSKLPYLKSVVLVYTHFSLACHYQPVGLMQVAKDWLVLYVSILAIEYPK